MSDDSQKLLEQAETALIKLAEQDQNGACDYIPAEEYRPIKAMFEEVLAADPENERAQEGLAACDEMLNPIHPVQHLAPMLLPDDLIEGDNDTKSGTPWERRHKERERERALMRQDGEIFSKAEEEARAKLNALIDDALAAATGTAMTSLAEILPSIRQFQEEQNMAWKGHGPDVKTAAVERLLSKLGLTDAEAQAAAELKASVAGSDDVDWVESQISAHEDTWGVRHEDIFGN